MSSATRRPPRPVVAGQIAVDREQAALLVGVSKDTVARAIKSGRLRAKKSNPDGRTGGKELIKVADLETWVDSLPDADAFVVHDLPDEQAS